MKRVLMLCILVGCSAGTTDVESTKLALCPDPPGDCPCVGSPIIIDVAGNGLQMTDLEGGVRFSLRPGYEANQMAWTMPLSDDAWLVLDRDNSGDQATEASVDIIQDGGEMFGNFTVQEAGEGETKNGFVALRVLDDNGDGVIDAQDQTFPYLRLWRDVNHDGVARLSELATLGSVGITGLSTAYTTDGAWVDRFGNHFRYTAQVYTSPGSTVNTTAYDVWPVMQVPQKPQFEKAQIVAAGFPSRLGPPAPSATLYTCNAEVLCKKYAYPNTAPSVCYHCDTQTGCNNPNPPNPITSGGWSGTTKLLACQNAASHVNYCGSATACKVLTTWGEPISPNFNKLDPSDGCSTVPQAECRCAGPAGGSSGTCE